MERAILVGVNINNQDYFNNSMKELEQLALACEISVAGQVIQNMKEINISHYIGKGKINDVIDSIQENDANLVIFNDELSPSQIRNIEQELEIKVIDRTILILDIFNRRAKTKEAQLQVGIAHLQYMLPRLIGLRKSLGRQVGGVGTRNKGVGEKKLELDRRIIEDRIAYLNKELEKLVIHRKIQRRQRIKNKIPIVALVGYTNSGKSTLLNALIKYFNQDENKMVYEENMLFATLETSVRRIELPDKKLFLLTDTVGFIDKLPHHLIKAFRSTLEEVTEANLLIDVVDYSDDSYEKHIDVTRKTLREIGVKDIPVIYAYNKSDLVDMKIPYVKDNEIYLSARYKLGIDELIGLLFDEIFSNYVHCSMIIPFDKGDILSYLNENADVINVEYIEQGTKIDMKCRDLDYRKYKEFIIA